MAWWWMLHTWVRLHTRVALDTWVTLDTWVALHTGVQNIGRGVVERMRGRSTIHLLVFAKLRRGAAHWGVAVPPELLRWGAAGRIWRWTPHIRMLPTAGGEILTLLLLLLRGHGENPLHRRRVGGVGGLLEIVSGWWLPWSLHAAMVTT